METRLEMKLVVDDEELFVREIVVTDSDKEVILAAITGALDKCSIQLQKIARETFGV